MVGAQRECREPPPRSAPAAPGWLGRSGSAENRHPDTPPLRRDGWGAAGMHRTAIPIRPAAPLPYVPWRSAIQAAEEPSTNGTRIREWAPPGMRGFAAGYWRMAHHRRGWGAAGMQRTTIPIRPAALGWLGRSGSTENRHLDTPRCAPTIRALAIGDPGCRRAIHEWDTNTRIGAARHAWFRGRLFADGASPARLACGRSGAAVCRRLVKDCFAPTR
jgi:hypothetical protein